MDGPRHELLAGAGLTDDHHREGRAGDALNLGKGLADRAAVAQELAQWRLRRWRSGPRRCVVRQFGRCIARVTVARRSSTRNGFSMKSYAPSRIASTVVLMSPYPLINTTGTSGLRALIPAENLEAV